MSAPEFDKYAKDYEAMHQASIAFSGCETAYFAEYKVAFAASLAPGPATIVDFGAGIGNSIPHFRKYFPESRLICADNSRESLALAARRFPGTEQMVSVGETLPLRDRSSALTFTACVFHHIDPMRHEHWLRELHRVTSAGGVFLLFEHNPYNPPTRKAVAGCEFDRDAILIGARAMAKAISRAGWQDIHVRYHVFFPQALAKLRGLEPTLGWLPLGGQYSVTARRG
jgi:ubiquinone/menaquinone biosynthesis C-methylase UbiE